MSYVESKDLARRESIVKVLREVGRPLRFVDLYWAVKTSGVMFGDGAGEKLDGDLRELEKHGRVRECQDGWELV